MNKELRKKMLLQSYVMLLAPPQANPDISKLELRIQ